MKLKSIFNKLNEILNIRDYTMSIEEWTKRVIDYGKLMRNTEYRKEINIISEKACSDFKTKENCPTKKCFWNKLNKCVEYFNIISSLDLDCKNIDRNFKRLKKEILDDKIIEKKIEKLEKIEEIHRDEDKILDVYDILLDKGLFKWLNVTFKDVLCNHNRIVRDSLMYVVTESEDKLYFKSDVIESLIKNCLQSKDKRFVLIDMYLRDDKRQYAHSNILIADTYNMEIERYEPHGKEIFSDNIDITLKDFFTNLGYSYIPVENICPTSLKGHQKMDLLYIKEMWPGDIKRVKESWDIGGFCQTWTVFWAHLRMSNPDIKRDVLFKASFDVFKKNNLNVREYIECFSKYLYLELWNLYKKGKIHIAYL